MGQGYSLTTLSAGSAGIDVPEMSDLTYEKSLGNARFMKSIRARCKDGLVVAKVVMKPYASMKLNLYVKVIKEQREILRHIPNALAYHRIRETSTNGYLVRQYIHSSLYDRLSTRPFLEDIEKKWLSFQLLCAVRDCHSNNVHHGDIKTENVLVTSWNWLYLSDFSSSFKPTFLPEDNPADFSFYFDTSGRRTCYLAPERFLQPGSQREGQGELTWAMDIFSVGCVIAELFLESPIFSLSQLFKYRQGDYDPSQTVVSKIHDKEIRDLVSHMIQLDPSSRMQAEDYLKFWRERAFPEYFYGFLHQYMFTVTDPLSGRGPVTSSSQNLGESDGRIEKIYYDFDKISYFLGHKLKRDSRTKATSRMGIVFPLHIDIPNFQHEATATETPTIDDGTLLFLDIVVSALRSTARATARIRACELMLAFAEWCTDEAKLDRIVPYLITLLNDKTDLVKVAALRSLTQVLALVNVVSPINAYIIPEYILPKVQPFVPGPSSKASPIVRATYASCLASLATTASRFLDMMQALRADGTLPSTDPEAEDDGLTYSAYQTLYDVAREDLVAQFEGQTTALLTDEDNAVRRAFLGSVSALCVFFGGTRANDVILSHLNTYLNDPDWMLKCAFFETIVGVATYVGSSSLEDFILPLMVQALTDPEEFVVEKVLRSFSSMAELGLFQRSKTWELVDVVGRFTVHPNIWIREAAAHFISSSTKYSSIADLHSILIPLLTTYLKVQPCDLSELRLLDSLKRPLPRLVLDRATTWAARADKSTFWKPAQQQRTFSFGTSEDAFAIVAGRGLGNKALSRVPKNAEDELELAALRSAGMTTEDETKLIALREYIWRVAHRRGKEDSETTISKFNHIVPLKDLGIAPQTVFFDHNLEPLDLATGDEKSDRPDEKQPRTIADALLDASTPAADEALNEQKRLGLGSATDDELRKQFKMATVKSGQSTPSDMSGDNRRQSLQIPKPRPTNTDVDSERSSIGSDAHQHTMRHKSSAIDLLKRNDASSKAIAETSTTSANAFGRVDSNAVAEGNTKKKRALPLTVAKDQHQRHAVRGKYQAAHTYSGHDPSVLRLLDSLYLENYPVDYVDFGPAVQPVRRQLSLGRNSGSGSGSVWRPEGILVATMGEHTGAVNRVAVAPDHTFFITGSDDGTVKVWDTARLERNIAHRSQKSYKLPGNAQVSSLTFVEETHCFVCTGTDGSVQVVKVEYNQSEKSARYGKLHVMREYQLPPGEWAVWSEHYKSESQSILVLATNTSRIVALELRTMTELFELHNPLHHGTPTCFCIDRRHQWLVLGTTHGVLALWDLRFKLRLKAWGFPGGAPIHRISLQPVRGTRKHRMYVAGGTGGGEITSWDLEKLVCKEIYRTGVTSKESSKSITLVDVDGEKAGGMLGRFATSLEPSNSSMNTDRGVKALALGTVGAEEGSDPKSFFLVSAGPDWKVRYWDSARPENSMVVSGLEMDESKPTYHVSQPAPETILVTERLSASRNMEGSKASSNSSAKREPARKSRSNIISLQQQHLLKSHLDTIMDVAILEYPYGMVASVDRSGVIFVFQ